MFYTTEYIHVLGTLGHVNFNNLHNKMCTCMMNWEISVIYPSEFGSTECMSVNVAHKSFNVL